MVPKRNLREGGEDGSNNSNKRRRFSTLLYGTNNARVMQELLSSWEPRLRKLVRESVESSFSQLMRDSNNQIECSGSRHLQLQFQSELPKTLFTGSRILSVNRSPVRIALYDSSINQIVTSGPLSSIKVNIVALNGDFGPDDMEDWKRTDFERNIIQNREGRRPLMTGELMVQLQGGFGYIGEASFTDNSSWNRSGKFRLGAKVHPSYDEANIREGMSNAFKVKDHRGESYQKHYPPSLDDEVWRLEKIAKDGSSHQKLTNAGIRCVRDFLRLYFKDEVSLRKILGSMSHKVWDTIKRHALTCTLNDERYMYRAQGMVLFFNTIHKLVGVTFDGQSYHSMESLDGFQTRRVETLKPYAYKKCAEWVPICDQPTFGHPMLLPCPAAIDFNSPPNLVIQDADFQVEQAQLGTQMNTHQQSISPSSYNCEVDQDSSSYEIGESSQQGQGFDPTFGNSYAMSASPGGFYMGNFVGTQLSTDDLPVDDNFQVESSSAWQGNGFFLGSSNHEVGILSSNSGILIPRNNKGSPKTRWCKVLAVVKWRILVRRNVAARKWKQQSYYDYV